MKLRPEMIPLALRDLIPFAERFGLTADTARHRVAEHASDKELQELTRALAGHHEEIEDWLYSIPEADQLEREPLAYGSLLVFELEECGGPGLRGYLDYAISKYRKTPSAQTRAVLQQAYDYTRNAAKGSGMQGFWAKELDAAAQLLKEGTPNQAL